MTELSPVLLQLAAGDKTYTARELRLGLAAGFARDQTGLAARSGVIGAPSLKVTQTGAGAQSVDVAAGILLLQGSGASQGAYVLVNDATKTVALSAAHATLPRIDIIYAELLDAVDGVAGGSAWTIKALAGTAAGSPSEPSLPAADQIKLAAIARAAADNTVVNGDITDRRVRTAAEGGVVVCNTVADIASPTEGMVAYETATDLLKVFVAAWWPVTPGASITDLRYPVVEVIQPNTGDFTSGSFTDIATFSAISVPTWAQDGNAHAKWSGTITATVITAAARFELRAAIGVTAGLSVPLEANAANDAHGATTGMDYTIPVSTTTITPKIQARRISGTGALRMTSAGLATAALNLVISR